MRKNILYILILSGLLTVTSCEVPYDIPVLQSSRQYVVDGGITDNPGPYTIKLTYSGAYSASAEGGNVPIRDAYVNIIDSTDADKQTMLYYNGGGEYVTPDDFQGITGHRYVLHILTNTGDELMSYPEKLPPLTNDIEGHYEYVDESAFYPQGDRVWLTIKDIPGEKDFYRWKYDGVYQFATQLKNFPFSSTCWQYEYFYFDILLASDQYFDGQTFDKDITVIPYFSGAPYLVTVTTESLTERAYNFWKLLDDQVNKSGGIFGTPPYHIQGNMYCVNKPNEEVLGYFSAESVKKTFVFMKRNTQGKVKDPRFYPYNINCSTFPNTKPLTGDLSDYPEGWQ